LPHPQPAQRQHTGLHSRKEKGKHHANPDHQNRYDRALHHGNNVRLRSNFRFLVSLFILSLTLTARSSPKFPPAARAPTDHPPPGRSFSNREISPTRQSPAPSRTPAPSTRPSYPRPRSHPVAHIPGENRPASSCRSPATRRP